VTGVNAPVDRRQKLFRRCDLDAHIAEAASQRGGIGEH
jgi:hypothetical protein